MEQRQNIIPEPAISRRQTLWIVTLGWFLFFTLWTLFILGWSLGEVSLEAAAISGVISTFTAASLGYGVWRLTGAVSWPQAVQVRFIITHLLAAMLFSILWTATTPVIAVLWEGGSISEMQWDMQVYTWRLFMGSWLYFIVAGLSYSARISGRLRHQQRVTARANLDAMRSRLHPHFLFNALHSVSAMIKTDPNRASDAMEMLGDLLRYAIKDRESDRVPFGEEWRFVTDYVELQQLRFGDRIEVTLDLGAEVQNAMVPVFILQPLVENAFVHGMEASSDKAHIHISAAVNNGMLELTVEDDGPGPSESSTTRASGTGISNLTVRLESLFGDRANFELSSRHPAGARAQVRIPVEEE